MARSNSFKQYVREVEAGMTPAERRAYERWGRAMDAKQARSIPELVKLFNRERPN